MPQDIPASVLVGPVLEELTLLERKAYLESLPIRVVEDRQVLFESGASGAHMYIVLDGTVVVTQRTRNGGTIELDRAVSGDLIGELAVISPAAREGTATTHGWTRLLTIEREAFRAQLAAREAPAEALLRYATRRICRRLRQVDARIALAHDTRAGADRSMLQQRIAEVQALGALP